MGRKLGWVRNSVSRAFFLQKQGFDCASLIRAVPVRMRRRQSTVVLFVLIPNGGQMQRET
jgi:hypothetical protein